jgi:ketosteroid isomerase-like protein
MSQQNVELVRRWFRFLQALAGRIEPDEIADRLSDAALGEFVDPEVDWVPVPQGLLGGNTYRGFDGVRRSASDFFAVWDEIHVEPEEFLDRDHQVIVVVRMTGRMHELQVDEVWSGLWTLRGGKIVRLQSFTTRDGALEAAGVSEWAMSRAHRRVPFAIRQ